MRKKEDDSLRELSVMISPHQFLPRDQLNNDQTRRLHDWLDPFNKDSSGMQFALKLKDERKRRVHLDSEHKRRETLSEAINKAALIMGMEGVPQVFVLQAVNQTIIDLRQQRLALALQLRERQNTSE